MDVIVMEMGAGSSKNTGGQCYVLVRFGYLTL